MTDMAGLLPEILAGTDAAIWIYDIDRKRVRWANRAALDVWNAPTLEELLSRDLAADMSASVEKRLAQYKEDFIANGAVFHEQWTLFPKGEPRSLRVKFSGITTPDGETMMVCEGVNAVRSEPEAVRSVEALLHTSVMISMFAISGEPLYSNPAARACYGMMDRRLLARFRDAREGQRFIDLLNALGKNEATVRVNANGGNRWHHLVGVKCTDAVTGETALLLSESDVTEAQDAQNQLELSRNEALKANDLKSEFLANMSHEIRTPLNGVLGMAQLLRRTELTAEQTSMIDTVLSSGETLLALINDVLDISRIETGLIDLEYREFPIDDVLGTAAASVKGAAQLKGIDLEVRSALGPGARVVGDEKLVRQVLVNLIGNAVKFSESGSVRVSVAPAGQQRVLFSVQDDGPGVPADQQEIIFERFRKGERPPDQRKLSGTGLGLSIARDLVHLMRGEIGVESRPGEGARFWFSLPLPRATSAAATRTEAVPEGAAQQTGHGEALVVEDNAVNAMIFSKALELCGRRVTVVESGTEAVEIASGTYFDLIVLDLQLPGLRGDEVLREIRRPGSMCQDSPVIVVTADATPEARIQALDAGAVSLLTKPFKINEFLDLVQSLSANPPPREDAGRTEGPPPTAGKPTPPRPGRPHLRSVGN